MSLKDKIREQTEKKRAKVARARERIDVDLIERAKKLGSLLKSKHLDAAVKVWIAGLDATKKVYDKSGTCCGEEPDWKERRENANMIVAYMEGRPVERQLVVGGNFEDLAAVMKKCQDSPEAMRLLGSMAGGLDDVQETGPEKQADVTREA
jgi:hypothetical protein